MSDCTNCTLKSRREFLNEGALALGAFVFLGFARPLAAINGSVEYAIPAQDGALIDKKNDLILVRWKDSGYAFALSCPHQRTALRWNSNDARFQCPKHKSKYEPDGTFISGKATRGMDRHPIRRDGAKLIVDSTTLFKQSDNAAAWTNAFVKLT
jgi:nitrite reductase/ring-hydroxylating ferredoxin subunit